MTFSIVAGLAETNALGVGVATRKPAIGGRVPFVRAAVGAIASQAVSNPWLGVAALDLLGHGRNITSCCGRLYANHERRQPVAHRLQDAHRHDAAGLGILPGRDVLQYEA